MMKLTNLLSIVFTFIVLIGHSQPSYPIQTVLKGDSVVILTKKQSDEVNLLMDKQRVRIQNFKSEVKILTDTSNILKNEIKIKDTIIDSLKNILSNQQFYYDSLLSKIDTLENWILTSSIDNGYLYYSWQDSTIKVIDLSLYMLVLHNKTGNYSLINRGQTFDLNYWKERNLIEQESPEVGWELNITPKYKPRIVLFPYKITPKL